MNHLRELIDLDVMDLCYQHAIHPVSRLEMHDMFCKLARNAMCFDMSGVDNISERFSESEDLPPSLFNLPYETCWFESSPVEEPGGVLALLVAYESRIKVLRCFMYIRSGKRWVQQGFCGLVDLSKDKLTHYPNDEHTAEMLSGCLYLVRKFVAAMNCQNVGRQEHKPDAALQKARAKRGKQPLFSYWTLELNGRDGGAAQSFGGTHASPRVHLRRGHPRQYAPGKWTWVQPHAVGNRELGMVHKDYVIGKEMVVH